MSLEEISHTLSLIPDHEDRAQGLTNLITSAIEVINVVESDESIQKEYKLKLVQLQFDVEDTLRPQLRDAESQSAQQQIYNGYKKQTHEIIFDYAEKSKSLRNNINRFKAIMLNVNSVDVPGDEIDTHARASAFKAIGAVAEARRLGKLLDTAKFRSIMSKFFTPTPQGTFRRFRILPKLRMPWGASNQQGIVDRVNRASMSTMMTTYTGTINGINPLFASPRHSEAHPRPSGISGSLEYYNASEQSNQSEEA